MMNVTYKNTKFKAVINEETYFTNGNTSIQLFKEHEDPSVDEGLVVSVNVPQPMPDEFVCIKNWNELEGIEASLIDAGILEEFPVNVIPSGMVRIPVYELTDKALQAS